jgi:DNA mismatch repair protein MSH2
MDFKKYQEMIESTLDLDEVKNHKFMINSSYKPELKELKDQYDQIEEEIQNLGNKVRKAFCCF